MLKSGLLWLAKRSGADESARLKEIPLSEEESQRVRLLTPS